MSDKAYADQQCTLARSLEVIGERWTLLIVRDCFYGVTHFGDFVTHLGVPRAVLADRLATLTETGVLQRSGAGRSTAYSLTERGVSLWPTVLNLMMWGLEHFAPNGANRVFVHADDGGEIDDRSVCTVCGRAVRPSDIDMLPGPGLAATTADATPVDRALREPRRLLAPLELT